MIEASLYSGIRLLFSLFALSRLCFQLNNNKGLVNRSSWAAQNCTATSLNILSIAFELLKDQCDSLQDEALLRHYANAWNRYSTGANIINQIFSNTENDSNIHEEEEDQRRVFFGIHYGTQEVERHPYFP
ncbi:hypothetical protein DFJ58DRAFT_869208, partial [Suillus subalutaceus]|uniref:uncharacterized protein n=1 Tax=Suillus subalutaceus TaxID=48586 RepID=UPI001B873643